MENNYKRIKIHLLNFSKQNQLLPMKIKNDEKKNYIQLNKRNYGIDLLRIFSMINVFNLHINLYSGIYFTKPNSPKFVGIWRLETFSYFAVDCFGLISGIVGYKKYNFSNLIYLWILAFFYSVLFEVILFIKYKKNNSLFISFFPILISRQWYFNAYFSMYLFLPFLNIGINKINIGTYRNIVIFLIGFFSFYNLIAVIFNRRNYHFLNEGYTSLWLIILYIIGGYFGKYIIERKNNFNIKYFFIFSFIYIFSSFFSSEIYFILLKKRKIYNKLFISYLSPTILIQAMSLIMAFSKIKIYNKFLIKIISFFTPLTFSTLFIHCFLFVQTFYIKRIFIKYVNSINFNMIFFKIYGLSILAYFFCAIFDYFRFLIFKFIKIKELSLFITKKFGKN